MADREKIIKGLECCRRGFCLACPYNDGIDKSTDCKQRWADDALVLLKAQDPRVMTLEEARNALHNEIVVWTEVKCDELYGLLCGVRMNGMAYFHMQNDDVLGVTDFDNIEYSAAYGKLIRLWTSQPTDAQMRETPWRIDDGNANG